MSNEHQVYSRRNGSLFLEEVRLSDLLRAGLPTPFFLYSHAQLSRNYGAYARAVADSGLPAAVIGYAVKANHNPAVLRLLRQLGAGAVVVSQLELLHALRQGFDPARMLLHGNGKRPCDIDAALQHGVLLSADSPFDLDHIEQAAARRGVRAQVLLRVNPDIDAHVHPYISTGLRDSKFGLPEAAFLFGPLRQALSQLPHIVVRGLHCHIGSTLREVAPIADAARLMVELSRRLRQDGHPIDTLDLGGGLDIDYRRTGEPIPTPADVLGAIAPLLRGHDLRLFLEPGRSLVGNAGALVGRVLGCKGADPAADRAFLVTDASMAQLIRPSLYDAYHHIELLDVPDDAPLRRFDVVGPICESADFLGKDRLLPVPREGDGLLIHDAGAYGFSMASRYNLHLLCAEYLIHGAAVRCVRRAETYDDFAATFADEDVPLAHSPDKGAHR